MSEIVTNASAESSIRKWSPELIESFNNSETPWNITGQVQEEGEAPNTVSQVLEFLGNELSERSFELVNALKSAGIKLGFVAAHNPCF